MCILTRRKKGPRSIRFYQIMFRGYRGKVKNVSANQRPGRHLCWPIGPRNTNVVQSVEYLISCQVCSNSIQRRSTDVEYISEGKTQFRTYTKARGFSKIEHNVIAWDSRYLPELESEMRSVLDIDMSFFGFEVCINFVRMRSENVPHLYFWHTAIGIQNQKCRLCDFPCAEKQLHCYIPKFGK